MRATSLAALAGAALLGATVVTATSASADAPAPRAERQARSAAPAGDLQLQSAMTARGNLRVSGGDRYQTAAEISKVTWEAGEAVEVVLASGTSFPDALAWGSSSLGGGPLLLTERDRLPEVTRAELARLRPCQVIVLGGTSAVSDAVFADAEQYSDPAACAQ